MSEKELADAEHRIDLVKRNQAFRDACVEAVREIASYRGEDHLLDANARAMRETARAALAKEPHE